MLRWWTSGLRFGTMAAKSRLRTGQMYGLYLRFVGYAFLFQQAALDLWTGKNFDINPPAVLSQSIPVGGLFLPL